VKRTVRPGEVAGDDEVPSEGPAAGKKTLTAMLPPSRSGAPTDDPGPDGFPELTAMARGLGQAGARDRDGAQLERPRPETPAPPALVPRGPRTAEPPSDPPPAAAAPTAFVDDPFALHTPAGARGPGRPAPTPPTRPRPVGGGPTESEPEDDEP
jgi:hypothetical protein